MRISDWSSDVCSSDLGKGVEEAGANGLKVECDAIRYPQRGLNLHRARRESVIGRRGRQYDQSHAVGGLARIGQCLPRGFDGEAYRCLSFRRDMAEADAASLHNPLVCRVDASLDQRSEEHTSELQSLMRISY